MLYIAIGIIFLIGIIVCTVLFMSVSKDEHELQVIKARNAEMDEFYNG